MLHLIPIPSVPRCPASTRMRKLLGPHLSAAAETPTAQVPTVAAALPSGVLDGGEIVLLALKPAFWRIWFDAGWWVLVTCMLAAVLTWTQHPIPGLSLAATAQVLILIGVARVAVAVVHWIPTWYVLTNRRVLTIQGVRQPEVTSCLLVDLRHAEPTCSVGEKLTRLGSVVLLPRQTDGVPMIWQSIATPDAVLAKIRDAADKASHFHTVIS